VQKQEHNYELITELTLVSSLKPDLLFEKMNPIVDKPILFETFSFEFFPLSLQNEEKKKVLLQNSSV
jgi:hypothetical protein